MGSMDQANHSGWGGGGEGVPSKPRCQAGIPVLGGPHPQRVQNTLSSLQQATCGRIRVFRHTGCYQQSPTKVSATGASMDRSAAAEPSSET
ncbi:hypothetical protein K227x_45780 [Rubripirellula lacrimiformis]|uniref:Uncharacterized protein n=1 Tax=Rubripirellula lacrimiformis TaxID=1930273 RepID=A0A517NGB9_9BACT|nr:hypothetical protein K227x_45780 [Rubripirellula lacrimiformis]